MSEILTDEQASAIWSGQTASITGIKEDPTTVDPPVVDPAKAAPVIKQGDIDPLADPKEDIKDDDITKALAGNLEPEEEDEDEDVTKPNPGEIPAAGKTEPPKTGRKPTDLVKFVNQLVSEEVLSGFANDKDEIEEVKTIDEAKALIKANLDDRENKSADKGWEKKLETYSPQVRMILHYADKGVQSANEIIELIGAIKSVEDVNDLTAETPEGQEAIIREAYKARGFKDSYIDKQVTTLKDLDKLKENAEELLPEIKTLKVQEVQKRLAEQEDRDNMAKEASKVYFQTVKQALDKEEVNGMKLLKEDKSKIFGALADQSYISLNGERTNQFVKTLEELQFGKQANYEQFLNIVHYTVDPKGFIDKLKQSIKNDVTEATHKKLKTSKTSTPNSEVEDNRPAKNVIKKSTFVNPYS